MDYTKFFDPDILEMVGQARKEVQKTSSIRKQDQATVRWPFLLPGN